MQRPSHFRAAMSLAPLALLMIAVLLLGWGVDDLRGFFAEAARSGVIVIIACELAAGTVLGIELNPFREGNCAGRRWPIIAGVLTVPFILAAVAFCDRHGVFVFHASWVRWIGVGAFVLGSGIRLAALYELGRQYSAFLTIQTGHQLIRSGVYRRIRHPFYLGGLLNLPGLILVFRSPVAIALLFASVIFVLNRIGREERLLEAEFPTGYREYRQASWRLLPHVY